LRKKKQAKGKGGPKSVSWQFTPMIGGGGGGKTEKDRKEKGPSLGPTGKKKKSIKYGGGWYLSRQEALVQRSGTKKGVHRGKSLGEAKTLRGKCSPQKQGGDREKKKEAQHQGATGS